MRWICEDIFNQMVLKMWQVSAALVVFSFLTGIKVQAVSVIAQKFFTKGVAACVPFPLLVHVFLHCYIWPTSLNLLWHIYPAGSCVPKQHSSRYHKARPRFVSYVTVGSKHWS